MSRSGGRATEGGHDLLDRSGRIGAGQLRDLGRFIDRDSYFLFFFAFFVSHLSVLAFVVFAITV